MMFDSSGDMPRASVHSAASPYGAARHWDELEETLRRVLDVSVSGAIIVFLLPLLLALALLVKLDSPGPVLFRQVRIGRNRRRSPAPSVFDRRRKKSFGKPFEFCKFRTMYCDARERFPELYRYDYSQNELRTIPIKLLVGTKGDDSTPDATERAQPPARRGHRGRMGDDPRVTRIGRWLRRTSLDELPNLHNVLKGDMHLVGPRPDIADNIRYYTSAELSLLEIKPGVTGLAQIRGRGHLTFEQTNACDLEYVKKRTLWLDLKILVLTIPALLQREGAY